MIGIIDYGMGNLLSVYHALEMVGALAHRLRRNRRWGSKLVANS